MESSDVDAVIDQLQQLTRNLDRLPDVSDIQMALMYLRHLRKRRATPVAVPVTA